MRILRTILKEDFLKINYIYYPEKLYQDYEKLNKEYEILKKINKNLKEEIKKLEFFVIKK